MIIADHSLDMEINKLDKTVIDVLLTIILNTTQGGTKADWNFEEVLESTTMCLNSFRLTPKQLKQALAIALYYMQDQGMNWFVHTFFPDFNPWPEEDENRFYCFNGSDDDLPF